MSVKRSNERDPTNGCDPTNGNMEKIPRSTRTALERLVIPKGVMGLANPNPNSQGRILTLVG
jgi:hypothetical protein